MRPSIDMDMIGDIIEIFKARKDPALAAKLGARFASGVAIERLSWPLMIAKFWMGVAILVCVILTGLLAYSAYQFGWGFLMPLLLPAGAAYGFIRIWRGLNKGIERVKTAAQGFTDKGIDRLAVRQVDSVLVSDNTDVPQA